MNPITRYTMNHGKIDSHITCPTCKNTLDGFAEVADEGAKPKDGDISICVYCGSINKYTNDVKDLIKMDQDSLLALERESPEDFNTVILISRKVKERLN